MSDEPETPSGPYHMRLPLWPLFKFQNNDIDGRVPVCQIEDWQSFERLIEKEHEHLGIGERIYRGQRRHDWPIAATLTREVGDGAIPKALALGILKKFKLAMRGRGADMNSNDEKEVWAFGQHFGLATPLLDWTESPFVALFFAFAQDDDTAEKTNGSRAVFSLNRGLVEELLPDLFFEPVLGENSRLVNQAGLFTVTPPGGDNLVSAIINTVIDSGAVDPDDPKQIARYLYKVHIPNMGRPVCLSMLRRMNIHHANLFPDPSGASQFSNDWLRREVAEWKKVEAAKSVVESRSPSKPVEHTAPTTVHVEGQSIEELLSALIIPDDAILQTTVADWARRIASTYEAKAALDWPLHEAAHKEVNVLLRRLLTALGFPKDRKEAAVQAVVKHLAEDYKRKTDFAATFEAGLK